MLENTIEARPTVGELIAERRAALSLSQEALAGLVKATEKTIRRWEKGTNPPKPRWWPSLREALKVSEEKFASAIRESSISENSPDAPLSNLRYEVLSLEEIQRRNVDPDYVFSQLGSVISPWRQPSPDSKPGDRNFMGHDETWDRIALKSPSTHFYLIEDGRTVVAFWSFVAVDDSMYAKIRNGERVNESFGVDDVIDPMPNDELALYFIDFFPLKRVAVWTVMGMFLDSFKALLTEWRSPSINISIKKVTAHLSTPAIITTAKRFGFEFCTDHSCHTMYTDEEMQETVPTQIHELVIADKIEKNSQLASLFRPPTDQEIG